MKKNNLMLIRLTALAALMGGLSLHAANLTWDADTNTPSAQDGAGNWTAANASINWWDGSANVTWNNLTPDNATFGTGSGAAGVVTVPSSTTNTVGNITFSAPGSGGYNLAAGNSASKINLSGTPTITVASGVVATNLVVLTGTSFTKLGAGTLVLKPGAANINSGPTVVGGGTLSVISGTSGRLVIPGNLTITNGASVIMGTAEQIADAAIITVDGGTFDSGGKSETIGGFMLDNNGQVLSASSSQAITNNGSAYDLRSGSFFPNLAGTAGLNKTTAGTVVITNGGGANTFSGPVVVSAGILDLGHSGVGNGLPAVLVTITNTGMLRQGKDTQIQSNATVNIAGGTYELLGHNESVSAVILDNGGSILNGGNTSKTLTVLTNLEFRSGTCASKLAGAVTLVKTNSGTVTVTGANVFSGGASVNAGTLLVNNTAGSGTGTNAVTVKNSATLGGSGIILGAITVQAGGNLAPGNAAIGTLTISNSLTLGGNMTVEINKGIGQDLVEASLSTVNYGGTLTIANVGGALSAGDTFTIVNAGAFTGNFTSIAGSAGAGLAYGFNPTNGVLSVVSTGSTPPALNVSRAGSTLTFSWSEAGFKLQSQTNNLSTGLNGNWFDYPGGGTSPVGVTINPANPSVFFRLSQ
jgi:autotransporter-associated beta strand protein